MTAGAKMDDVLHGRDTVFNGNNKPDFNKTINSHHFRNLGNNLLLCSPTWNPNAKKTAYNDHQLITEMSLIQRILMFTTSIHSIKHTQNAK
jgi:hypothetical protein